MSCATSSSVDGKSNQLSLFHILDEISAPAFPLTLTSFCVAALFEREPDDADNSSFVLTITLDDALLASFTMSVDFSRSRRNRSVHTIQGLTIPAPGLIAIALVQKTRVLADWRLLALLSGGDAQKPSLPPKPTTKDPNAATKPVAVLN